MKRCLCLLCFLFLLPVRGMAEENPFRLLNSPMEVAVTFQADQLDIHDATRLQELNALLGHVGLTFRTDPAARDGAWSDLRIDVDGKTAAAFTVCAGADGTKARLPGADTVWTSPAEDPVEALFPEITLDNALAGIPLTLLDDVDALLNALMADREAFLIEKDRQNINGYGNTQTRWTLRGETGDALREPLLKAAQADWLRQLLGGMRFADGCQCYLLVDNQEEPIKTVLKGTIQTADGLWENISLTWRRKRTAADSRNGLELELSRQDVVFGLSLRETDKMAKNGTRTVSVTGFTLTQAIGEATLKTNADPIKLQIKDGRITGTIKLKTGVMNKTKLTDVSQLTLDVTAEPDGTGAIGWAWKHKENQTAWSGTLRFAPLTDTDWERFDTQPVPLPDTEVERAAIRAQLTDGFARLLLARLVLADPADTVYLRRGMDDAAWNEIVSAAETAVKP